MTLKPEAWSPKPFYRAAATLFKIVLYSAESTIEAMTSLYCFRPTCVRNALVLF
jgi:hypothetical protein